MAKGIILYGALGDIAAISAASHHFNSVFHEEISLITEPGFVNFANKYGSFREVISFDKDNPQITQDIIASRNLSTIIDLHNTSFLERKYIDWLQQIRNSNIVLSKMRASPDYDNNFLLTDDRIISANEHNVEYYMRRIGSKNFKITKDYLRIFPAPEDLLYVQEHKVDNPKFIGIVPKSRFNHKELPNNKWIQIINSLKARILFQPTILCADYEIDEIKPLADAVGAKILASSTPEGHVKQVLLNDIIISVDTGMKHMAGYLHMPLVALYGHTDANIWNTQSSSETSIRGISSCLPCNNPFRCVSGSYACMNYIPIDVVVQEVSKKFGELK